MKIVCIFGTRPEAITLAPVVHELKSRSDEKPIKMIVCITDHHREMLDQLLSLFDIEIDYDLNVMAGNYAPSQAASAILAQME